MKSKKINQENFRKYGKVLTAPEGEPTAQGEDFKFWSNLADYEINGPTEIGFCTVYKQLKNLITGMERHLNTPEILIPIDAPFVLPVHKEGESEKNAEAFQVDIGEVVVIGEGVWHGACLPVGRDKSSYFVIFKQGTPKEDLYKKEINEIEIEINS